MPQDTSIPIGLCQCGCGEPTLIANFTNRKQHQVKGQPNRFIQGHRLHPRINEFVVRDDGSVLITLTQGQTAVIDVQDLDLVRRYRYHAYKSGRTWYARRNITRSDGSRTNTTMHQDIMGEVEDTVDHEDNDGLNNRRFNLRVATRAQQAYNRRGHITSSGPKGVSYRSDRMANPYIARLGNKHLGVFSTEAEAAAAYDRAASEEYGPFAKVNQL